VSAAEEKELTIRDLLRTFDRRRQIFFGTAGVVFLLAILACIFMTRRYEATGVIELQKSSSDSLDLEGMMGGDEASGAGDSLSANLDLQTQTAILQSETLVLKVANDLNLEKTRDFQPHFNPMGAVMGLISPHGPPDPPGASLEDSPGRRRRVTQVFGKRLKVEVTTGTRLIEVEYSNPDPKVAAAVVNNLMQGLIDYTFQAKYTATNQVSEWLGTQLGSLRKNGEDLQSKVVALQKDTGLFGVGGTDLQGKPLIYSPILDRLQESTTQLSEAELNRIIKESVYQVVKTGNAELISQLSGTSMGAGANPGVANSLTLIQNLRTQEATMKAQIAQDASQLGPSFPRLIQERANLTGIEQALKDEIGRMAERSRNDYEIAQKTEDGSRKTYETDRSAAEKLNDKAIEYALLSKEADESEGLYQDLLKRLKEAGILGSLHATNLTVVDPARPPAIPSAPNVPLILALGLGLGLFLGAGVSIGVDAIDNKVQGIEEIEAMNLPVIGLLPKIKAGDSQVRTILSEAQDSSYSEAIRGLRSTVLLSRSGAPPKVLLVTSGSPGEGKSTISFSLAASLAQLAKSVLLVEVDLRRPTLRSRLKLTSTTGLSPLLSGQQTEIQTLSLPDHPNLSILLAGPVPPYPAELLGSARMKSLVAQWEQEYDFIVMDCPPVLPVTDVRLLIGMSDACVLIARAGVTTRLAIQRAYRLLVPHAKNPELPAVGILLNAISVRSAAYYGYYGYYGGKKYEYRSEGDENEVS
jgi:capsular exopolysaccharide synthesis family protein